MFTHETKQRTEYKEENNIELSYDIKWSYIGVIHKKMFKAKTNKQNKNIGVWDNSNSVWEHPASAYNVKSVWSCFMWSDKLPQCQIIAVPTV